MISTTKSFLLKTSATTPVETEIKSNNDLGDHSEPNMNSWFLEIYVELKNVNRPMFKVLKSQE